MNRLLFEKTGDAVYLSHLDLMRLFQRAFKRAGVMVWHTQGFSPRAYVSIALPLSVGVQSRCELLDFSVEDGAVDITNLPERLNATLPDGVRVLRAYESTRKIKNLALLEAKITLEYDNGVPDGAQQRIAELFRRQELKIAKRTKRGEAEVDIKPLIRRMELRSASAQELELRCLVSAQNPGLNPQLLVTAIEKSLPDFAPDFARIERVEVYEEDGTVFR